MSYPLASTSQPKTPPARSSPPRGDQPIGLLVCNAGATATPNYMNTHPGKTSPLAPRPQQPQQVVDECLRRIGTIPSFVSGAANKWVTFLMRYLLPKKVAIRLMSDGLKKMYRIVPLIL